MIQMPIQQIVFIQIKWMVVSHGDFDKISIKMMPETELQIILCAQVRQKQLNEQKLRRINDQLTKIVHNCQKQHYKSDDIHLLTRLNSLQVTHAQEIQALTSKASQQQRDHRFQVQQLRTSLNQLQQQNGRQSTLITSYQGHIKELNEKVQQLQHAITQNKKMQANQESLIDEFKHAFEEQIQLEKEVIYSTFDHKELMLKNNFAKALHNMERQFLNDNKLRDKDNNKADYKHSLRRFRKDFSDSINAITEHNHDFKHNNHDSKHNKHKQQHPKHRQQHTAHKQNPATNHSTQPTNY